VEGTRVDPVWIDPSGFDTMVNTRTAVHPWQPLETRGIALQTIRLTPIALKQPYRLPPRAPAWRH